MTAVGERSEFSFTEHDESDGSVRVCLVGELDAVEAPGLQDALRRLEGEGSDVLLDVSGLSFMDLFGLHLIEEAADAARQGGFGFALAGPVPVAVRQVFVEAGAEHHLPGGQARLAAVPPVAPPRRRRRGGMGRGRWPAHRRRWRADVLRSRPDVGRPGPDAFRS